MKYEPLSQFLKTQKYQRVVMTFNEVEQVLGVALPPSAYKHRPWWANEAVGHVHAKSWLEAGYETEQVDMTGRKLVFKRKAVSPLPVMSSNIPKGSGMSDSTRTFTHAEGSVEKKAGRHPLIGALKGTFTIDVDFDLTGPMLSDEELAEIDANLERTAELIEQGMSKKP